MSFSFSFSPAGVAPPPPPWSPRLAAAGPGHLPRPARWPPLAAQRRFRDPVPAARRSHRCRHDQEAQGTMFTARESFLPPGPSAPAQLTSPADGPGPASLPTEAVCLDREPPQGPPARAGGARVRVIALLDQSPATPGHLIESERAESRAPAPAREQRVRGRAHLLLWMPQTSRLPSVAIICRAGLNAA